MSDGPHRSLNMRPHWRLVAQRAANAAHSASELCEIMPRALKKDILGGPVREVREIMNSDTLFPGMRIEQLEALRGQHPGSAAATSLINCAIEAAADGRLGETGAESALRGALEENARAAMLGIDEHYQREPAPHKSRAMRTRLDDAFAQLDCGAIAREILAPARPPSRRSVTMPVHSGVDQGPPL